MDERQSLTVLMPLIVCMQAYGGEGFAANQIADLSET
jgi:hypothetical protein